MRVYWTDRAKHRLRLIHDYIAQDAPLVAAEVVARLLQRSRVIGAVPYAGRQVPEYARDDLREVLTRSWGLTLQQGLAIPGPSMATLRIVAA